MTSTCIVMVSVLAIGGDDPVPKKDEDRIQGTWTVTSCQSGANPVASPNGPHEIDIQGDKLIITLNGRRAREGITFVLNPEKAPREINLLAGGSSYQGIYELDGNSLKICYNSRARPTRFDAQERAQAPYNVLYVLTKKE